MKLIVAAAALMLAPAALAGPNVRIGVVDDAPIWNDAGAQVDLAKAAGFDSIRITAQWSTGMTAMSPGQTSRLQRAALFASMRGLSPIVSIYNASGAVAPNSPDARAQFVEFAQDVVTEPAGGRRRSSSATSRTRRLLAAAVRRSAAATRPRQAYVQLLACRPTTRSRRHARTPPSSAALLASARERRRSRTRRRRSSATSVLAYRASGRKAPIMDVWDEHVYADTSALPPSMPHGGPTVAEGDYAKLVALLGKAFDGTAQRGSRLPIFYGEYGVETTVPASKAGIYSGSESAKTVDEATQASFYAEAFRLALCQPNVIGLMVFHTLDEGALGGWQSGPYYADGTPKSSLPAIRDAALAARAGSAATCPDRTAPAVSISTLDGLVTAAAADGVGVGKVTLR